MRWYVEVSRVGENGVADEYCVEAKQWQAALQEARKLRGDSGALSKFSIELLDRGYRAVDPALKLRYLINEAPADAKLSEDAGKPKVEPAAPRPKAAESLAPTPFTTSVAPVASTPSAIPRPASYAAPRPNSVAPARASSLAPRSQQLLVPDDPVPAAPRVPGGIGFQPEPLRSPLPSFELVRQRAEEPRPESPITYREFAYAVAPGATRSELEALLQDRYRATRAAIEHHPPGKFVQLAVFDHVFKRKPERPPLATFVWKDWRGAPVLAFPGFGEAPMGPVSQVPPVRDSQLPANGASPSVVPARRASVAPLPSTAPGSRSSFAPSPAPAAPSEWVPDSKPLVPMPVVSIESRPAPPAADKPPSAAASELFQSSVKADLEIPVTEEPLALVRHDEEASSPEAAEPLPLVRRLDDAFPSEATEPLPLVRRLDDAFPAEAAKPEAAKPEAAKPEAAKPEAAALELHFESSPLKAAPQHHPVDRSATPNVARASRPRLVVSRRRAGEDLIGELFELMHELHFMRDVAQGAEFVLSVLDEVLPCEGALIHVFDIDTGYFVVVRAKGPNASAILLQRMPGHDPLALSVMRSPHALSIENASADPRFAGQRFRILGVVPKRALCGAVQQGGRYLGLIELANPQGDSPFHRTELNALDYICQQFAEFLSNKPIVLTADVVLAKA